MGVWAVGIVDTGVVDEFEAVHGRNLHEWDFYYGDANTDGGRISSHGTSVALAVEQTNSALERIDLQVGPNAGSSIGQAAADAALNRLITLHDQGWNIGSVNLSWGGSFNSAYVPEINALAARGIFAVAATGNGGSHTRLDVPWYPAALSNVIAVGSHDGQGNPTGFSQNHPSYIHVLADGENFPGPGINGTSFSAPQVAAGVATVQALADSTLERRLSFAETVDVLQQGGAAALSNPDPANGVTRYHLFDQNGSVDYFLRRYLDPEFSPYEYMASHGDIAAVFAGNPGAARAHLIGTGVYEGREVSFDGLEYIASHRDLIGSFGTDRAAGALHFLSSGRAEGRLTTFDGASYLAAHGDLQAAFGSNVAAATRHYITSGFHEGRAPGGGGGTTTPVTPVAPAVSEGSTDLPSNASTSGYVGVGQSVTGRITLYDRDWFRTELTAGQSVTIEARGSASGGGTLYDPELRVYGSNGNSVAFDYDSGAGFDALLRFTPSTSGTYYLEVDGWLAYTGTYTLSVAGARTSELAELPDALGGDPAGPLDQTAFTAELAWKPEYSSSVDGFL